MPNLSVTIITLNEAANIRTCLESVKWADEIIIFDSGSKDDTIAICHEYTDRVFIDQDWQGFGVQKNRALEKVTGDWVLSLDADEMVTPELAAEIREAMESEFPVYELPRLSTFCGREIRHSGWWPDYVARLFRNGAARFSNDPVHERLLYDGEAKKLEHPLLHHTAPTLHDVIDKMNRYSSISAEEKHLAGKKAGLWTALSHGFWTFLWSYFGRAGFLDGREGFVLAVSKAENSYYRYLKLMYLNEKDN